LEAFDFILLYSHSVHKNTPLLCTREYLVAKIIIIQGYSTFTMFLKVMISQFRMSALSLHDINFFFCTLCVFRLENDNDNGTACIFFSLLHSLSLWIKDKKNRFPGVNTRFSLQISRSTFLHLFVKHRALLFFMTFNFFDIVSLSLFFFFLLTRYQECKVAFII
jgi:hypothetical protein